MVTSRGPVSADVGELVRLLEQALVTHFRAEDLADRRDLVLRVFKQLDDRGIDGESLLRYGMSHRAGIRLFIELVTVGVHESPLPSLPQWRELLGVPEVTSLNNEDSLEWSFQIPTILSAWIAGAPLRDVLMFEAPTQDSLRQYRNAYDPSTDIHAAYGWLADRCLVGELEKWDTSSLHMEYRWVKGLEGPKLPIAAYEVAGPAADAVAEQIALRVVRSSPDADHSETLFWQLQRAAGDFLAKGKHVEAAALFEFHTRQHPDDARSINNLGFCRIPVDPGAALTLLRRAQKFGYEATAMNVYNQCCCLFGLNRLGEALDRAEAYWQRERDDYPSTGYLWRLQDGTWVLDSDAPAEVALCELLTAVASDLGLTDRASKWSGRLEELRASRTDRAVL